MPRPKRTKVASRAAAPTRVANPSDTATPAPQLSKVKNATQVIDTFSDDSDGLVLNSRRPRNRRMPWQPEPQKDVDYSMSGALPVATGEAAVEAGEETEAAPKSTKPRSPQVQIPSRTPSTTASKSRLSTGRRGRAKENETPIQSRLAPVSAQEAPNQEEESSLLDPSLLSFGSLDESPAHGTCPPSVIRVGGTPAHETSILALTNFRRRGRQPSLLRMVHQTTDVEDNDLDDLDDLDDFNPDDESTPLKTQRAEASVQQNDTSGLSISSTGSRGKKRKLSSPVLQVPRSSPPVESPPAAPDAVVADSQRSSSPSLPEDVGQTEAGLDVQGQADPEIYSDTMAPPMSSSQLDDIEFSPPPQAKEERRPRRGRPPKSQVNDETARNTKPARKQTAKSQAISTAKLQALLPRPRTRPAHERDEYDVVTSDDFQNTTLDSDQDELQLPAPRARNPAIARLKQKSGRTAKKANPAAGSKKNTRTYGRRSSDKENGSTSVADEESTEPSSINEPTVPGPSEKLAAIAKKFEDVDAWDMAFEEVDVGGGSSSPWR